MGFDDRSRCRLGFLPTPVVELKRLSAELRGPRLFIKRDDQSGVALGGNKVRKLEYLLGDALSRGADTIVTGGAAQSNHCRQTAAAAAMCGLGCHLALGGREPVEYRGNLLLDRLLGATFHWCGTNRKGETIPALCEELRRQGKRPYIVPYGGSNPVGACGFVEAMRELSLQQEEGIPRFGSIVFASSSGGTHAGMLVGARLFAIPSRIVGVSIDKEEVEGLSLDTAVIRLAGQTAELIGLEDAFFGEDVHLSTDYLGEGYGIVGEAEREAVALTAQLEGVMLDPVYTGRAMAGLIDMVRKETIPVDEPVLFWHTGGTPALFAYGNDLFNR